MNANEITKGLEDLAVGAMPATIDLWPRVRARVGAAPKRRATPRRRAIALIAAGVLALTLTLAGLAPTGTNAATGATTGVLNLFGLQPIGVAPVGPGCMSGGDRKDPVYTSATPTDFTIAATADQPTTTTAQAVKIDCPDGYTLSFTASAAAPNVVLSFFGLTTSVSAPTGPSCVDPEGGKAEPIRTPLPTGQVTVAAPSGAPLPPGAPGRGEAGTFTVTTISGEPAAAGSGVGPGTAAPGLPLPSGSGLVAVTANAPGTAMQITCPAGYELTLDGK